MVIGLQNRDIALCLNLSTSTIETHRKNIRKNWKLLEMENCFNTLF
ncbi:LuxR C-terminal-related transcriptional regulator [Psychroserpens sp.]